MNRKIVVPAVAVAVLAFTGCTAQQPGGGGNSAAPTGDAPLTSRTFTASPSLGYIAPLAASSLALDEENGLVLELTTSGASSAVLVAGVIAGEYDFMIGGATSVIESAAQGAEMMIVCGTNTSAVTLAIRNDAMAEAGITADDEIADKVKGLRGMTVVTSAPGSINYDMLRRILIHNGLDPETDVTIVTAQDGASLVAGLAQGQFDASFYSAGVAEAAVAQGEATVVGSVGQGDFEDALGQVMGSVVAATKSTVEDQPALVTRMIATMEAAEQVSIDDPDAVKAALKDDWFGDLDESIWDASWDYGVGAVAPNCDFSEDNFETIIGLLSDPSVADGLAYEDVVIEEIRS